MNPHFPSPENGFETGKGYARGAVDPAAVLYARDGTIVTYHWLYAGGIRYNVAELRYVTKGKSDPPTGVVAAVTAAVLGFAAAIVLAVNGGPISGLVTCRW